MSSRALLALLPVIVLVVMILSMVQAGPGLLLSPNSSIEAGSTALFNLSINNTNSTLNITAVNITLPSGFSFIQGSNQTSASYALFTNGTQHMQWLNLTQEGFIGNLTQEWFAFNASVTSTPGVYNFTVNVTYTDYSVNQSFINVTVNDTTPPRLDFVLPSPDNNTVVSDRDWLFINVSSDETLDTCLLDNGTINMSMSVSGSFCYHNLTGQANNTELYLTAWANDTSGNMNRTAGLHVNISLTDCNTELSPEIISPVSGSVLWGEPLQAVGYLLDKCGSPVENATVQWKFSKGQDWWLRDQDQANQSQGWYNYTWTETERNVGWYNITMNVSKSGYPDNYTHQEDSFFIALAPDIISAGFTRTSSCPDTFDFWARVTDADNNYNNISLEIRKRNDSAGQWDNWTLINYTWQDGLAASYVHFYPNLTQGSWPAGTYSYRFNSTDEFGYTDIENGSGTFMIYNCSMVNDIMIASPTPGNGSTWSSPDVTINTTFTSPWYTPTECTLVYNNGTETNLTDNASKGWCSFDITEGSYITANYSVWVGNTYTNDSWNGTWYIDFIECVENWTYGSWSECSGGTQTRSATDLNSCGTTDNRSALSRECDDSGGGGGGGGSETYPIAKRIWSSIRPGTPVSMEIDVSGIAATSVTLEVSESVRTSNMIVRGFSSKPSGIEAVPGGRVHSYMNITTTVNYSRLSRAVVEFHVERSWTEGLGIEPSSVRLMRLSGEWEELDTILLSSDDEGHSFRAEVPGFSWFAITGQLIQNETGDSEEEPSDTGTQEQEPGEETPGQPAAQDEEWELCNPGESQCVAGVIRQVCNGEGNGWVNKETCYYGCRDGECSDTLLIEIDIGHLWVGIALAAVIIVLALIYIKRKAIDDFIFWRL